MELMFIGRPLRDSLIKSSFNQYNRRKHMLRKLTTSAFLGISLFLISPVSAQTWKVCEIQTNRPDALLMI